VERLRVIGDRCQADFLRQSDGRHVIETATPSSFDTGPPKVPLSFSGS